MNTERPPSFRDILPVIPTSSLKVPVVAEMPPLEVTAPAFHTPVVIVPTVAKLAMLVTLGCVACVVAVSGASPAIVATVPACPVVF